MTLLFKSVGALIACAAVLYVVWKLVQRGRAAKRSAAMREFSGLQAELAQRFLEAASLSGKPRGLRWTGCELQGAPLFAVDTATGELVALVAATVSFAAIEGGGMEEVEAVGNLRSATATFVYRRHAWGTDGRVIFNLEPAEALAKFAGALRAVE
ncbi:hypothetical protein [Lacipirellula sp.]|uniref:hypothetical protein n=1 Tax=Lacipirellula sp. TaxID=2691419 RepID=UPI003D116B2C